MINDTIKNTLPTTLTSIIESTMNKVLQNANICTTPNNSSNTNQPFQRQPRQPRTLSSINEKQTLFLMHSYERIYKKTFEIQKYTSYLHFNHIRTPREVPNITFRYLNNKNGKEPIDSEVNDKVHQQQAIQQHLASGKQFIQQQQQAIATMFQYINLNEQETITAIQQTLEKAYNNCIKIKNSVYQDIYLYVSNASIQSLHERLRTTTEKQDLETLEKYIEASKQLRATESKSREIQNHLNNNTIPAYLQQHQLQWLGPTQTTDMLTTWKTANDRAQRLLLEATANMLEQQDQSLREQIRGMNIKDDGDTNTAEFILFINKKRTEWTKSCEDANQFNLPANFKKLIDQLPSHNKHEPEDMARLYESINTVNSKANNFIVTTTNYRSFLQQEEEQQQQNPQLQTQPQPMIQNQPQIPVPQPQIVPPQQPAQPLPQRVTTVNQTTTKTNQMNQQQTSETTSTPSILNKTATKRRPNEDEILVLDDNLQPRQPYSTVANRRQSNQTSQLTQPNSKLQRTTSQAKPNHK